MENDKVGNQLIVFDHLALFVADILGNNPFPAKKQPLDELIELFTLGGR